MTPSPLYTQYLTATANNSAKVPHVAVWFTSLSVRQPGSGDQGCLVEARDAAALCGVVGIVTIYVHVGS